MNFKKLVSLLLAIIMVFALVACGSEKPGESEGTNNNTASGLPALTKETIHIGAVFNTEIGTEGFSYALGMGFKALENAGYKVTYALNIPESAESETAIESLIAQGCNVIYANSYGFGEFAANVAQRYPNIYFNHYSGSNNLNNLATFFPKNFQSEYLCGIIAGMRTETNEIGYLCSYPIPECLRMVNAFTLGAQSVNPDVTVNVKWTGSWVNPATETAVSKELVNSGCDVIIAYVNSLNAAIAASDLGAWSFSYATSGYETIPNSYLSGPACNWEDFLLKDVQRIVDGTWTGSHQWHGIAEGLVTLCEMKNLAEGTEEKVNAAIEGFKNGTLDIWAGELKDNAGNVVVAEGATMSDAELLSMMWLVEGVNGSAN